MIRNEIYGIRWERPRGGHDEGNEDEMVRACEEEVHECASKEE